MGNSDSNPVRNMDKRTARRTHRNEFITAIDNYRSSTRTATKHAQFSESQQECFDDGGDGVRVCVRKRPIHSAEISASEFDVVSCLHGRVITVHDARMHSDMRHMLMHHCEFQFDRVFSELDDNDSVYMGVASPLVCAAARGGYSTVLMYGQTGAICF